MNSRRVYSATFENVTIGTTAQSIMECQLTTGEAAILLRAWISPAIGTPVDEVIAISVYGNDAAATGGTAMTEQPLTPAAGISTSRVGALLEPTIGATPLLLYSDAFHLQNGWLYLPVPEERPVFFGGNSDPGDNFGLELAVASTATPAVSGGMIWEELSST